MLALGAACVRAWKRSRAPLLVFLWFSAALFPALGFIDVWPFRYSFVADHFAHAAMPAMATAVVLVAGRFPRFARPALCVCIAACLPLSWVATARFADEKSLWRDTLDRNPDAWIACNNLGGILVREAADTGDPEISRAIAEEALAIASRGVALRRDEVSLLNRSEALRLLGRVDEALADARAAREAMPTLVRAHWAEARLLELSGNKVEAAAAYARVAAMPGDAVLARMARVDAVRLAVDAGDLGSAIQHARMLVAGDPADGDAIVNLGALLAAGGDVTGGRIELRRAITTPVRFSSEQVVRSAALRYLQLAITAPMDSVELVFAADLAGRIAAENPQDPSLRFLVLALELRGGRQDARTEIERIEREARAAGATNFADEVASFLRSLPQAG
jgi:tetratricopeptide (TPR) repeat protein